MNRTAKDKRSREPKPVQKIEVSDKNVKLRIILLIMTLIIGATAIGFGVRSCVSKDKGWTVITPTFKGLSVADEFTFTYYLGKDGSSPSAENRAISALYGDLCQKAYKLFEPTAEGGEIEKINSSAGEYVEIDGALYSALKLADENGGRILFTAPYFEILQSLFYCSDDYEASLSDPYKNEDAKELFSKIAGYVNSSAASLSFGEGNKVKLSVSEEYKEFAKEVGIRSLIGFTWLKNAFVTDYISGELAKNGFTNGVLSSKDGFFGTFDTGDTEYSQNVFGKTDGKTSLFCRVAFKGPRNGVYVKNLPIQKNSDYYYVYENGEIVTPYIDNSGKGKTAADGLYLYGKEKSVGELALIANALYVADEIDAARLKNYAADGIYGLYVKDGGIYYTEEGAVLRDVYSDGGESIPTVLL